jgi:phosphatidylglycerol:prolipoprotein diacylglycerol transferase
MLAAIPYVTIPSIEIGSERLTAFDMLVALAVIVGVIVGDRRAKKIGLNPRVIADVAIWAVLTGFMVSHWVAMFAYSKPAFTWAEWYQIFFFWNGMSSLGGFIGGAMGFIAYFRFKKIPLWPYANAAVYGFTFAWIFGRLACSVAHDHPGLPTDFFLAVDFPATTCPNPPIEGAAPCHAYPAGPRFDLGFHEFLWAIALSTFFFIRRNKPTFAGYHCAVFLIAYTPIRFINDFLRTADVRYPEGGLTPGQYITLALLPVGICLFVTLRKRGEMMTSDGNIHVFADGRAALPSPTEPATAPPGVDPEKTGKD